VRLPSREQKAKTVEWRNEAITSFFDLRVDPEKKGWGEEWRERKNPQWKRNLMASSRKKGSFKGVFHCNGTCFVRLSVSPMLTEALPCGKESIASGA